MTPRVLVLAGDVGATIAQIRLVEPLSMLARQGACELRARSFHDCRAADLEWADAALLQRPASHRAWQLQQCMRASGGAVVVEIDDLLTRMPPTLLHAAALQPRLPWLRRSLAAADVVSVSTARLGRALAEEGAVRNWSLVPNGGAGERLAPRPRTAGPVNLLFVSSDQVPVAPVVRALAMLQGRALPPWQVHALGPVADALAAHGVPVLRQTPLPRPQFAAWVRGLPNAVAVIPLGDTAFDACKSAIKFYDYALAGVPVVCAALPPYADAVEHGATGWLVAGGADAWADGLTVALCEPERMAALAVAAAAEVQARHRVEHTAAAWQDVLTALPERLRPAPPALGPLARWVEGAWGAFREANRARLARRRSQRD